MSDASLSLGTGARLLVVGLGRSGIASVEVLRERGATVYATDEKPPNQLADAIAHVQKAGASFVAPDALDTILDGVDSAVVSPGVPINGPLIRRVQAARIPVLSEIEVAYRLGTAPIVAVTGTKGKTTTTALIGHLFRTAGRETFVGGNIGNPLIRETIAAGPGAWVIAEVSSFQLESIRSFKPRISLLLNISPDHLDRYHSMDEYAEAKYRIFANQGADDTFVGNLDDERIALFAEGEDAARLHARALWFASEPHRNTTLYLRGNRTIVYAPPTGDPRPVEVLDVAEIPLLGAHNVQNVMAAVLVALAAGIDVAAVREGVLSFRALPHRLEPLGEVDGVAYYDDSKATNPGSVIAALRSFDRPVILIAGGKGKGTDFSEFGKVASSRTKAVVLIGEVADEMAAVIKRATVARAASMDEAVRTAASLASAGDIVLLSPGAASFDMFRSAEDRGEQFAASVRNLGTVLH